MNSLLIKFLVLYFINLLLDFPLQGSFLSQWKSKNNYILFVHCSIWSLGLFLSCIPLGLFEWWKLGMLLVGHYIIDYWKCRGLYKKWPVKRRIREIDYGLKKEIKPLISDNASLYIDQTLHLGQVILLLV